MELNRTPINDNICENGGYNMELSDFLKALNEHNKIGRGYQIHLNSGCLEKRSQKQTDIEFNDIYFTHCTLLGEMTTLCFDNSNKQPIKKDGKRKLYPMEINSNMSINLSGIEAIEDVDNFEDWFELPSTRMFTIYMLPENDNLSGNRNIVTVGLM